MNMEANSTKISKTFKPQTLLYMGNDRIGELPDVLLHHILSFLRTKQAVQTSILSRRWRHLWTSVDSLNLDVKDFTSDKSFRRFIHQVLNLRDTELDVLNFRISWPWIASTDINTLIRYASDRKAESVEIDCWRPCLLFSSPSLGCSLRVLKLVRGWLGGQQLGLQIFCNLKTLHISDTWAQIPLEELIQNCPALEELSLKSSSFQSLKICSSKLIELAILNCTSHDGMIELSCPNLIALSYRNPSMDCTLENLLSLSNAYFCWFGHKGVLKFLNALCYVKVLTLDCLHLESINKEALDGSLPRFPNLVSLTIRSCPLSTNVHAQAIAFLLLHSPALETLIIDHSTGDDHSINYHRKRKFMVPKGGGWSPNGLCFECFSCLKVVEFRRFGCSAAENELLKFVSQNARVLERITVFPNKP